MWNTFKYTLLWLVRSPDIMVWALLFPLVLTSVFIAMFGPLDDMAQLEPMRERPPARSHLRRHGR